jgi:predicted HTH domain antitoxin
MRGAYHQLNIRVSSELVRELEEIARLEGLAKTDVARRLLKEGIKRWKLEHALRLYQEGRVTKERASEIAGVSIYEILDAVSQRRIPSHYSLEEAMEDLEALLERVAR